MRVHRLGVYLTIVLGALLAGCQPAPQLTEVELSDGDAVVGQLVSADDDGIVVETPDGQQISIARNQIVSFGVADPSGRETTPATGDVDADDTANDDDTPDTGAEEPEPELVTLTVPAGTELSIVLDSTTASDTSTVGDLVRGALTEAVTIDGREVFPANATVIGAVIEATPSGRVEGRARLGVRFESIQDVTGSEQSVRTSPIVREAEGTVRDDATTIGIGAGAGAVIGGLLGGGGGARTGTVAGAGAGTAGVLLTSGDEVRLAIGTIVRTRLQTPLTIQVPVTEP